MSSRDLERTPTVLAELSKSSSLQGRQQVSLAPTALLFKMPLAQRCPQRLGGCMLNIQKMTLNCLEVETVSSFELASFIKARKTALGSTDVFFYRILKKNTPLERSLGPGLGRRRPPPHPVFFRWICACKLQRIPRKQTKFRWF